MLTYDDLVNDMVSRCKPKSAWRIGLELEQFAFNRETGGALSYDGSPGIRELLETFAAADGWTPVLDNGNLIALQKDGMNLTLEPGGQVEYSGSPLHTIHETKGEMERFYRALNQVAESLNIGFLAQGLHPQWTREEIDWMPKARYDIMHPYMETKGDHGVDMMLRTCGTQINIDFDSEADMVKKFRVAIGLQPVVTAMMANSSIKEGKDTDYVSYRSFIWTDTDPDRCGILPFVFSEDMSFARYVDYVLDVPMYFIRRGGQYINVAGKSFRAFMDGTAPECIGERPTIEDWHDHLSTLFPEVRLKHYLELRGMDSSSPEMVTAMTAFWVGLLYNETALNQAWEIIKDWPVEEHQRLRDAVPRYGLEAALNDPVRPDLCGLAKDILAIAEQGLSQEEKILLSPFQDRLVHDLCSAKTA